MYIDIFLFIHTAHVPTVLYEYEHFAEYSAPDVMQ